MDDIQTIAKNIKFIRDENHFSTENVAAFLGVDNTRYLEYESSEIPTPPDLHPSDMKEIAHFKKIVKAYLKMKRIASESL